MYTEGICHVLSSVRSTTTSGSWRTSSGTTSAPPSSTAEASERPSTSKAGTVRRGFWHPSKNQPELRLRETVGCFSVQLKKNCVACRFHHHGGPDLRLALRGNLRPGAAEGLHAEENVRALSEAIRPEHRRIPPSVRYLWFHIVSICVRSSIFRRLTRSYAVVSSRTFGHAEQSGADLLFRYQFYCTRLLLHGKSFIRLNKGGFIVLWNMFVTALEEPFS